MVVNSRGGWSQGGAKDAYIGAGGGAGDAHAGRLLAGLNPMTEDIARLPPHFYTTNADDAAIVNDAVTTCFPGLATVGDGISVRAVLRRYLATLVYQGAWMQKTLAKEHVVFTTPLFTRSLVAKLLPFVQTGVIKNETTGVKATGISMEVANAIQIRDLRAEVQDWRKEAKEAKEKAVEEKKQLVADIVEGVGEKLVDEGATADPASKGAVKLMIEEFGEQILQKIDQKLSIPQQSGGSGGGGGGGGGQSPSPPAKKKSQFSVWAYPADGRIRKLPPGEAHLAVPRVTTLGAGFKLFINGNLGNKTAPVRSLVPDDFFIGEKPMEDDGEEDDDDDGDKDDAMWDGPRYAKVSVWKEAKAAKRRLSVWKSVPDTN